MKECRDELYQCIFGSREASAPTGCVYCSANLCCMCVHGWREEVFRDLLNEYVEEMVAYCHTGKYDSLRETCDTLRWQLVDEKA
uniref:Uncharacterized protein n=1 Tax=Oryza punctata TaxID=4537 RepID=A0A0E0LNC6_ORYPU